MGGVMRITKGKANVLFIIRGSPLMTEPMAYVTAVR